MVLNLIQSQVLFETKIFLLHGFILKKLRVGQYRVTDRYVLEFVFCWYHQQLIFQA